ncbi:hypothetical protein, partial [Pseudomonas syringae group genomosp. 7]|uniref:hypothetical protein n=1 Tax=Pseudomonas syringae group genomosp. 7 TaxID=251699 RepID=UPI0037701F73
CGVWVGWVGGVGGFGLCGGGVVGLFVLGGGVCLGWGVFVVLFVVVVDVVFGGFGGVVRGFGVLLVGVLVWVWLWCGFLWGLWVVCGVWGGWGFGCGWGWCWWGWVCVCCWGVFVVVCFVGFVVVVFSLVGVLDCFFVVVLGVGGLFVGDIREVVVWGVDDV